MQGSLNEIAKFQLGEGNQFFVVRAAGISGRSVGKIILILNLGFGTSRNKNIDNRSKENCAHESNCISLLRDYTMPNALNFGFLSIILQPKKKRSY